MEMLTCPLRNDELEVLAGALSIAGVVRFEFHHDPAVESDSGAQAVGIEFNNPTA